MSSVQVPRETRDTVSHETRDTVSHETRDTVSHALSTRWLIDQIGDVLQRHIFADVAVDVRAAVAACFRCSRFLSRRTARHLIPVHHLVRHFDGRLCVAKLSAFGARAPSASDVTTCIFAPNVNKLADLVASASSTSHSCAVG